MDWTRRTTRCAQDDSNVRPPVYQTGALPLSYARVAWWPVGPKVGKGETGLPKVVAEDPTSLLPRIHLVHEIFGWQLAWMTEHAPHHPELPAVRFLEVACQDAVRRVRQAASDPNPHNIEDVQASVANWHRRIRVLAESGVAGLHNGVVVSPADILGALAKS
jgi:hypothetical protein